LRATGKRIACIFFLVWTLAARTLAPGIKPVRAPGDRLTVPRAGDFDRVR